MKNYILLSLLVCTAACNKDEAEVLPPVDCSSIDTGALEDLDLDGDDTGSGDQDVDADVDVDGDDTGSSPDGDDTGSTPDGDDTGSTPDGDDTGSSPDGDDTGSSPDGDDTGATGSDGDDTGDGGDPPPPSALMPDFELEDTNPTSVTFGEGPVSPRALMPAITGWYFTHAG